MGAKFFASVVKMKNTGINLRKRNIIVFGLIIMISFIIYANSLNNKFVFDDRYLVVNNNFIKHFSSLTKIFQHSTFYFAPYDDTNYYRPLAILSYALDYSIWRLSPFGYHLINVFLHSICGFLLFLLVLTLFNNFSLALLSSVLFTIHPIHTSGVNYIACRDNFLATAFGLLSIIYYLFSYKYNKRLFYLWSLMFFFFSLLSKESALLNVFLIMLCAVKIGENNQFFESINNQKIAEKLKEFGFDIKKTQIGLEKPIKELGEFPLKINLEHNLEAEITVIVTQEKEEK